MKNRFIAYHEDWGRKIGSDYTATFDLKGLFENPTRAQLKSL